MGIRAVLLDIAGVLHDGRAAYPGAIAAVRRLEAAGLAVRFVTNTSRRTRAATVAALTAMGFSVAEEQVFTAPLAGRSYLVKRGLRPLLIIHPDLAPDLAALELRDPNAVFLADAAAHFTYARLDEAFRLLVDGAPLVAVGRNRYFREAGTLHLDAGPFVAALEFAAGCAAVITGKPAAAFFQAALDDLGTTPDESVMIGDDVEADVVGAAASGMRAILVQTGKFRDGDATRLPPDAHIATDLADATRIVLAR